MEDYTSRQPLRLTSLLLAIGLAEGGRRDGIVRRGSQARALKKVSRGGESFALLGRGRVCAMRAAWWGRGKGEGERTRSFAAPWRFSGGEKLLQLLEVG